MYILSDIHGELKPLMDFLYSDERFCIQLGDWGLWFSNEENALEESDLDLIEKIAASRDKFIFTILGNHECWPRYMALPTVKVKGAKCWKIRSHIFAVQKGEILSIEGKNCLCVGGADSIDKDWRLQYEKEKEQKIWWKEEEIGEEDIENAKQNLSKLNGKVDFVFTHTPPAFLVSKLFTQPNLSNSEIRLDAILNECDFGCWYCGHLHTTASYKKYGKEIRVLCINEVCVE